MPIKKCTNTCISGIIIGAVGVVLIAAGAAFVSIAPFHYTRYGCYSQTQSDTVCSSIQVQSCCATYPNFASSQFQPCGTTLFDTVCQLNITSGRGYCCSNCQTSTPFCILNPTYQSQTQVPQSKNNYGYIPVAVGLLIFLCGMCICVPQCRSSVSRDDQMENKMGVDVDIEGTSRARELMENMRNNGNGDGMGNGSGYNYVNGGNDYGNNYQTNYNTNSSNQPVNISSNNTNTLFKKL